MKPAIEASAGTGKTTRVVELLLERLLGDGIEPARLLALTFTVRAANEMRDRLGQWLARLLADEPVPELPGGLARFGDAPTARRRAEAAVMALDRVEIGTIHSFASHLLRQYPLEAGVSPAFAEDDGRVQEALFRELWPAWLDARLGQPGAVDFVERCLGRMDVAQLARLTRALCEEGVPLALRADPEGESAWRARRAAAAERAATLHAARAADTTKASRTACAALAWLGDLFRTDPVTDALRAGQGWLRVDTPKTKDWSPAERAAYAELRRFGRALVEVDDGLVAALLAWLRPFVEGYRAELGRRGAVSFQGLIVRATRILREHRDVREHLKRRFRQLVVDEFQDTDPQQSELLLYLAERDGDFATDWREVVVEPGKLVIVGDPKQSIYLFRGADLDAYRALATRLTGGREEQVHRLVKNYRARHELIAFVNAIGPHLLREPPYVALEPSERTTAGGEITLLLFDDLSADAARAAEAEALAAWIESGTAAGAFARRDVALLLRALPDAQHYTEAFRRRGIDFAIEGEKGFYGAQEVLDTLNLLLTIADPTDELAAVGTLRAPLGGVPDRDLVLLRDAAALSPLDAERVPATLPHVRRLWEAIGALHARSRRVPAAELLQEILARFPLLAIARASPRAEQAVANVVKLLQALAAMPGLTLAEALDEFRRRSVVREEEGEAPLADEQLDAVRILSIHKAKGLEFPIVVLPDLHRAEGQGDEGPVLQAWLAGLTGFRAGRLCNRERVLVEERVTRIREEETDRLLYVALTRARDRLVLTGGGAGGGVFLGRLRAALRALGLDLDGAPERTLVGSGFTLRVTRQRGAGAVPPAAPAPPGPAAEPDYAAAHAAWVAREAAARRAAATPPIRIPSAPREEDVDRVVRLAREDDAPGGRTFGAECHDLLARVDLGAPERLDAAGAAADLVRAFVTGAAFREIATADEVHREVPFVIELEGEVWSGQLDVLYRRGDHWVVADYKSDRDEHPGRYRLQARVYTAAVQRLLGLGAPPEFRLLYLRSGRAVPLRPHS